MIIIKMLVAVFWMVLIALSCTSCACGGGGCSVGGTETHQLLNQRLNQAKLARVQNWEAGS